MTLYRVTARRWSLGLLALFFFATLCWAKAQASNPASSIPSSTSISEPNPADNPPSIVTEKAEKTPPRSATDSTLDSNSRRAGTLRPGEESRFFYSAQAQESVGLLLFPPTLQVEIRPDYSWKKVSDNEAPGSLLRRIKFLESRRYELIVRNRDSDELEFSVLLISLSTGDLQSLEYGRHQGGKIETAGDVDIYAIDVADSVELGLVLEFMSESNQKVAFILSPENGLKYFGEFREGKTQEIKLPIEKPETLIIAISTDQGGSTYRIHLEQKALEVFRLPPAGESEVRIYLLASKEERSIPLALEGRKGWDLQIEKSGEPFHLEGELRSQPIKFAADRDQRVAKLQPIQSEDAELILKNLDSHPRKVTVKLSAGSRNLLHIPHVALFIGCALATLLFWLPQFPWTGPFNHLHFPNRHYRYCLFIGFTSFVSLAVLLWLGTPLLSELQKLSGFRLEYLAKASGFTGFFITLYWIKALVKGRQEIKKQADKTV